MRELKVYLKSRLAKVYFYTQALVGLILIINSLRLLEGGGTDILSSMICIAFGLVLIAAITIPVHLRRNLRYLPGLLIAVGGILLMWNTKTNIQIAFSRVNQPVLYIAYVIIAIGVLQPLFDIKQYAYFGKNGVRYKFKAFQEHKVLWNEVANIDYHEKCFDLILKSGKVLTMTPLYAKSINLRVHVDKLWHDSKSNNLDTAVQTPPIQGQAVSRS